MDLDFNKLGNLQQVANVAKSNLEGSITNTLGNLQLNVLIFYLSFLTLYIQGVSKKTGICVQGSF